MKQYDAVRLLLTTHLSDREIGLSAGLSKTTVGRYRNVIRTKRLTWEQVSPLDPAGVHALFNRRGNGGQRRRQPAWELVHEQMQRKGMTLQLLWEEYRREGPHDALCYSQFAARYRAYRGTLPTVMRQYHEPGERVFVDYSGLRPHYFDQATQQKVHAELFVGVLPASGLFFAFCSASQKIPDWIDAHVAMLNYFGGAPQAIVPDNLRSAITKPGRSPIIQRTYADLARHYNIAIVPARPNRPRDKAAVEQAVKFAQQRILVRLRHQTFYALDELNTAVAGLLNEANDRPMVKDNLSRRARFEAIERAKLSPLPAAPYVYAEWVTIPKVPRDYHVAIEGHFYSVPYGLVGERLEARVTRDAVEFYRQRTRVAAHRRSSAIGRHTTIAAHQPEAHRAQAERAPTALMAWAGEVGPFTARFIRRQFDAASPIKGTQAGDALRGLARKHGTAALERAARASLDLGSPNVSALQRLLANQQTAQRQPVVLRHANVRRASDYLQGGAPCQ